MLVGLPKLPCALLLMMSAAGVGFSLQYFTVALALTAAISYALSLPGGSWSIQAHASGIIGAILRIAFGDVYSRRGLQPTIPHGGPNAYCSH